MPNKGTKTPTKIKELQGTARKDRRMNNEMTPKEVDSLGTVNLINNFADHICLKLTKNLSAI